MIRNIKFTIYFALTLTFFPGILFSAQVADEPEARAIMEKVDAKYDGENFQADMKMILIDKKRNSRVKTLKSFSMDHGEDKWSILFFTSPLDVKDTGFLTYDYDSKSEDDQWIYLPAFHKIKRIASDDKTSSFMGSDFSYADMTDPELDLYDFKISDTIDVRGQKCWVIESLPRSAKVVEEYGYTKSLLFVRQDCHIIVRAIHFIQNSKKRKYYDITKLLEIDGIWTPLEIHMVTKKNERMEHATILQYFNVKYNTVISPNFFTARQLERGF